MKLTRYYQLEKQIENITDVNSEESAELIGEYLQIQNKVITEFPKMSLEQVKELADSGDEEACYYYATNRGARQGIDDEVIRYLDLPRKPATKRP